MNAGNIREPQQTRSQRTLERILSSSTKLIHEKTYDDVSVAEIASCAQISVGGFYSRFENKEALFQALLGQLAKETQERIGAALAADWSTSSLRRLLLFVVASNVELYDKYRGVLTAVYINTRVFNDGVEDQRQSYNDRIVTQIVALILRKRDEIRRKQSKVAIRVAVAGMAAMLRDAVVFGDTNLYPTPVSNATITRHVADFMYHYLTSESR